MSRTSINDLPSGIKKQLSIPLTHSTTKSLSLPKLQNKPETKMNLTGLNQNNSSTEPTNRKKVFIVSKEIINQSPTKKQKKPLKQYHKVNWSIAPKCLIEGHEGRPVIYVCVQPECSHITRLICEQCFYKEHKDHNKQYLAIDEIKEGTVNSLRFWPFDSNLRNIYQFIKKHDSYVQGLVQDIKASFENLAQSVMKTIKQTENKYLQSVKSFYSKSTAKSKFINTLIKQIEDCFQLKNIHNCVREIFNKEIRHDIFMEKMNNIMKENKIKDKQKLKTYFQSPQTNKGVDMQFDKIYFMKKQKTILENISQQEKALREKLITIDQAQVGIQQIVTQTIQYLIKNSQKFIDTPNMVTFQRKKFDDGTDYQGFLYKGLRIMLGMRDYNNGFKYYGEWKNNCRSGWGVYQNQQLGYQYAGYWKEDKKNGFGKQKTNSSYYEGNYEADRKQGFGTIRQNNVRYDITWKNDKKHGKGKRITEKEEKQVYFLNGIQSAMKGNMNPSGETSHKDVQYLAKMFAKDK